MSQAHAERGFHRTVSSLLSGIFSFYHVWRFVRKHKLIKQLAKSQKTDVDSFFIDDMFSCVPVCITSPLQQEPVHLRLQRQGQAERNRRWEDKANKWDVIFNVSHRAFSSLFHSSSVFSYRYCNITLAAPGNSMSVGIGRSDSEEESHRSGRWTRTQ